VAENPIRIGKKAKGADAMGSDNLSKSLIPGTISTID
jgi:hypothetical protein